MFFPPTFDSGRFSPLSLRCRKSVYQNKSSESYIYIVMFFNDESKSCMIRVPSLYSGFKCDFLRIQPKKCYGIGTYGRRNISASLRIRIFENSSTKNIFASIWKIFLKFFDIENFRFRKCWKILKISKNRRKFQLKSNFFDFRFFEIFKIFENFSKIFFKSTQFFFCESIFKNPDVLKRKNPSASTLHHK